MALKVERVTDGWRASDPDNPAVNVTHQDRNAAIYLAQDALKEPPDKTRNKVVPVRGHQATKYIPVKRVPLEAVLCTQERSYLSVADELLAHHGLVVPDHTRIMLTRTIAHTRLIALKQARTHARKPAEETCKPKPVKKTRTPIIALKRAQTHARKLLDYAARPTVRESRVAARCMRLRAALLNDIVAFGLGAASLEHNNALNYGHLLAGLENGLFDTQAVEVLTDSINDELLRQESWRLGRPQTVGRLIREGCVVWRRANREGGYSLHPNLEGEKLTGPLPAFVKDYFECCDVDAPTDAALHEGITRRLKTKHTT
jgi:hypothetical protein